jgi:hypothetical protein
MRSGSDYGVQYGRRFSRAQIGQTENAMVDIGAPPRESLQRNWSAIACLWLAVASWLALAFRILSGEIFSIDSALDWLYVTALLAAPVVGVAGLISIRRGGEPWLAIGAFVVSLLLPAAYAFAYLILGLLFAELGAGLD